MIRLGINIDHVATVRQARRTHEPDPVAAAAAAELGGADQITLHLREDRRHIADRDVRLLAETLGVPMNLEMGLGEDIIDVALEVHPFQVCLVPERREEVTTEGGLDVKGRAGAIAETVTRFHGEGIRVSCFIDPDPAQVAASFEAGADAVELHTGEFAHAWHDARIGPKPREHEPKLRDTFDRLIVAARAVEQSGRGVCNLGHGLTYANLRDMLMPLLDAGVAVHELNIGHSIIARALFVGLTQAVVEMRTLIREIENARPPARA